MTARLSPGTCLGLVEAHRGDVLGGRQAERLPGLMSRGLIEACDHGLAAYR